MLRKKPSELVSFVQTSAFQKNGSSGLVQLSSCISLRREFHTVHVLPPRVYLVMPPQTPPQRNEIVDWYQSIPPITKAIFTISVAATVAPALGLIHPYSLVLSWNALSKLQVELWFLSLSFSFSFTFLFQM